MCKYCDMTDVNIEHSCKDYFLHKSLPLKDDFSGKYIKADGEHPVMYLREYRTSKAWGLICEFADDIGTVVEAPIFNCPWCGRNLVSLIK